MDQHVYTQEVHLPATADDVFELLSVYPRWSSGVTIKSSDGPGQQLRPGSGWLESHQGALFLRQWLHVTVLHHDPQERSMGLCLDDGHNHIQQQLVVLPSSPQEPGGCRIVATLSCFQRTPSKQLVRSEKLAVMFRKADRRLASLLAYVQSAQHAAAAPAAAPPTAAAALGPAAPAGTCSVVASN